MRVVWLFFSLAHIDSSMIYLIYWNLNIYLAIKNISFASHKNGVTFSVHTVRIYLINKKHSYRYDLFLNELFNKCVH